MENSFAQVPRVTVVGSYAVGFTIYIRRMPALGETVIGSGCRQDHGGKGSNQAVAAARLGAEVTFLARVGSDSFGDQALQLMYEEGVCATWVQRAGDCKTGTGFILVDCANGQNCIVLDPGANSLLKPFDLDAAIGAFESADVVLAQLEVPLEVAGRAMSLGRNWGALTILNPAPATWLPDDVLRSIDILTPNEVEAKVVAGLEPTNPISPEEVARRLVSRGVRQVVVTLGAEGALIVSDSLVNHVPAISVSAQDTTGAGDAFNAALAVGLANGAALQEAVEFAVVAGGLAVTKQGVIPGLPTLEDMQAAMVKLGRTIPAWLPSGRQKPVEANGSE